MNAVTPFHTLSPSTSLEDAGKLVTFDVAGHSFGIAAQRVQDVLRAQPLTRIPLARAEVAGALNLRGHIVTAIDMRSRLGLAADKPARMCVVVECDDELYSLNVDGVGEVLSPPAELYESVPASIDAGWRDVATGVFRLEGRLLVVLDIERIVTL
jgi:purine-binding chemotaxis protein CheW